MQVACALAVLVALAHSAPAALAQLTVGPAGSGAQFTEIADAVAAATPNARIEVEPGTYLPFVVDKPLTIIGRPLDTAASLWGGPPPDAVIVESMPGSDGRAVLVEDIGADDEVHLVGLFCTNALDEEYPDGLVAILDCAGLVRTTNLYITSQQPGLGELLRVSRSSAVLLDNCEVGLSYPSGPFSFFAWAPAPRPVGAPPSYNAAVVVERSTFSAVNSTITGVSGYLDADCSHEHDGDGAHAIYAENSRVQLHRSAVRGGNAEGPSFEPDSGACEPTPGHAVWMAGGVLRITGGPTFPESLDEASWGLDIANRILPGFRHRFQLGFGGTYPGPSSRAIRLGDAAELTIAPDVVWGYQYQPGPLPPTIHTVADASSYSKFVLGDGSFFSVTIDDEAYPVLYTDRAAVRPGDDVALTMSGAPTSWHAVYFSPVAGGGTALPGIEGTVALSPATTLPLGLFCTDASGVLGLAATLPADPVLAGLELYFQSAEISAVGVRLSNLATLVVTP